jgi:hypothetical protein
MRREWQRLSPNGRLAITLLLIMGTAVVIMAVARGIPAFAGLMTFAFTMAAVMTYVEDPGRRAQIRRRR